METSWSPTGEDSEQFRRHIRIKDNKRPFTSTGHNKVCCWHRYPLDFNVLLTCHESTQFELQTPINVCFYDHSSCLSRTFSSFLYMIHSFECTSHPGIAKAKLPFPVEINGNSAHQKRGQEIKSGNGTESMGNSRLEKFQNGWSCPFVVWGVINTEYGGVPSPSSGGGRET